MNNISIQRNSSEIHCRDDFILVLNGTRCNPRCDRFEQIPHYKRVLEDVLNLIGVGICTLSFTALIIVSIIRWKKMCVPSNTCVCMCIYSRTVCVHCKKYLVKMTTIAWLLQFQSSINRWIVWLKEFQNTIIIHQPPHNSIKLQKASTDTCQQFNLYKFIAII